MIVALLLLLPVAGISVWIYVRTRPLPQPGNARYLLVFDGIVLLCVIAACAMELLYFKQAMENTVDRGWWPVLTGLAWLGTVPALLLFGGLLRKIFFR